MQFNLDARMAMLFAGGMGKLKRSVRLTVALLTSSSVLLIAYRGRTAVLMRHEGQSGVSVGSMVGDMIGDDLPWAMQADLH